MCQSRVKIVYIRYKMGILVTNGTLPNGIQVSNVYMSFFLESVVIQSNPLSNTFMISTSYRVFADPSKKQGSTIRFPIHVVMNHSDCVLNPYTYLYENLKTTYKNNTDWMDNTELPNMSLMV